MQPQAPPADQNPRLFNNFRGYDSHIVIQALANDERQLKRPIKVIGQGLEKFLLLEWNSTISSIICSNSSLGPSRN